jgi:hypothetical protein
MAIALICSDSSMIRQEFNMKAIDQMNLYDLATAFIAFGMVLGLALN